MYKLENNEEWTQELKDAFKHGVTKAYISYMEDGELKTIDENSSLVSIEIKDHKYVPKTGFIGQATSKMATIKLINEEQLINLENKEIEIHIGAEYNNETHYINYGKFIVTPPSENDVTNDESEIIAYDYMIKANQLWNNNLVYPCTLRTLAEAICTQIGITLQSESFTNENFIVDSNQFPGETCRTVLQNIAKCAFSWARIGQDNKLYFDFNINTTSRETITNDDYKVDAFKRANEYYGKVNKVTYAQSNIQGQEEFVADQQDIAQNGTKELIIYDNLFAYTTAKRHELIQAGTILLGFKYMPISQLDLVGLAYLDCNDTIEIQDMEGNTFTTRNFNHTIKYQGFLQDSIENEALSLTEIEYENKNSVGNLISKTEIIVDKQNQTIESVVENVTVQNNKIAQITQTVNELNSKISDIADVTIAKESMTGTVSLEHINQSEPITVQIKPTENISYLYPRNNLFPANDLYLRLRTLRFVNTTTTEIFDYELPYDLLYFNSEYYDEFLLDYGDGSNKSCQIIKRCEYDSNGNVVLKTTPETIELTYPIINLSDGDYIVSILKYDNTPYNSYIFVRLMTQNIYTTQFATVTQLNSTISQTADQINLEVSKKVGKTEIISSINQSAEKITINANKVNLEGFVTLTNLSNAGETIINGANITTGTIDANKATITNINANNIKTGKLQSENYVANEEGTSINLNNGIIDTAGFKVSSTGRITATGGTIGGFTIGDTKLYNNKSTLTANIEGIYIGTNGISLGEGSTFKVTNTGALTATSGTIADFNITNVGLNRNINGVYDYSSYDKAIVINSIMEYLNFNNDSTTADIADANDDGAINSADVVYINKVIDGTITSTKNMSGILKINANNPKNCFQILNNSNQPAVSIGLGGVNSNCIVSQNILCIDNKKVGASSYNIPAIALNGIDGKIFVNSTISGTGERTIISYSSVTTPIVIQTSKEADKKNFKRLENGLDIIKNIDIYKYNLKFEDNNIKKHIGFVIGDNFKYSQEITSKNNDGVDLYSFVAVCCKAIQEQQEQIEELKEKIK